MNSEKHNRTLLLISRQNALKHALMAIATLIILLIACSCAPNEVRNEDDLQRPTVDSGSSEISSQRGQEDLSAITTIASFDDEEILSKVPECLQWIDYENENANSVREAYSDYHCYELLKLDSCGLHEAMAVVNLKSTNGYKGYEGTLELELKEHNGDWAICDVALSPKSYIEKFDLTAFGYRSAEEIRGLMEQEPLEEGLFNLSIASSIDFSSGDNHGIANIENIPANNYSIRVQIYLDEDNSIVYKSPLITPGGYIEKVVLNRLLHEGTHRARAVFMAYDMTSGEEVGSTESPIKLIVKG